VNPFYKRFISPIENELRTGTGRNFSYRNGSVAESYGVEFEARFNLGFIRKDNKILNNLFVFANLALIKSKVELNVTQAAGTKDIVTSRPLQGQSPYVFNSGIQYIDPIRKLDISFTCNQVGDRIAYVANTNKYLVWEKARLVFDASVSKTFFKKVQTKITFGDILAQSLIFYQDVDGNKKYDEGKDVDFAKYKYGRTIQLSVGYTF
jgi:outer membrane receptor protein involved in Fe transport